MSVICFFYGFHKIFVFSDDRRSSHRGSDINAWCLVDGELIVCENGVKCTVLSMAKDRVQWHRVPDGMQDICASGVWPKREDILYSNFNNVYATDSIAQTNRCGETKKKEQLVVNKLKINFTKTTWLISTTPFKYRRTDIIGATSTKDDEEINIFKYLTNFLLFI